MSTRGNKDIVQRYFIEVVNQGNMEIIDEIMAEDVLGHDATRSEPVVGYENLKEVMRLFHSAFPGAQYPLYDILADGDKVVVRWGIHGAQGGAFMGIPASGKPVNANGIIIYRLKNQKIVEYWGSFDMLGLLRQLGAAP